MVTLSEVSRRRDEDILGGGGDGRLRREVCELTDEGCELGCEVIQSASALTTAR